MKFKGFVLLVYFILLIVLVVLGVMFAQYNSERVVVDFLGKEIAPYPLWIVIMISLFIGFISGISMMLWEMLKLSIEKRKYKRLYLELYESTQETEK